MAAGLGPICGMCCRPINEKFLLQVVDVSYHESCLQCCICGERLCQTCFIRDSKLYCRQDYDRMYAKRCLGCAETITPKELVMKTSDSVFHLRCFVCVVCGVRLQKGDLYVVKQGQLFCRMDYEKEVEMLQGYGHGDFLYDELVSTGRSHDGRRGPKRPRTILTTQQRRAFKASFEVSSKPCRKVRETLAKDTGLSVRIVQVWFQNQRAKMKKIQKKARQDNKGGKNADDDEKKLHVKEEEHSPRTSFYNDSCSDAEATGDTDILSHPGIENSKHMIRIKEEVDSDDIFFKRDTNVPLNIFPGLVEKLDSDFNDLSYRPTLESGQGNIFMMPPLMHQSLPNHVSLNPIDRLYSMQNSYFCSDQESVME